MANILLSAAMAALAVLAVRSSTSPRDKMLNNIFAFIAVFWLFMVLL